MSAETLNTCAARERQRQRHDPSRTVMASLAVSVQDVLSTIQIWRGRARARRELAALSERELQDMGTNWSSIADEVSKPFWRT